LRNRSHARMQKLQNRSSGLLEEDILFDEFVYIDARRIITIDEEAIQDGAVVWDISKSKLNDVYAAEMAKRKTGKTKMHFVLTGYVASTTEGAATTLQRDGSDYSAAIMGRLPQSTNITIWTDVDGVLSADPRRVPTANVVSEMSYNEAMELALYHIGHLQL
jgi:aspartokinase/homoserine dehydrogenase 1